MNPFTNLKYIQSSTELLDIAFARASKMTFPKSRKPAHVRAREREIGKLKKVNEILTTRLEDVVQKFPNFDEIHSFYRILADTIISIDELRIALSSVTSAARIIDKISREAIRKLTRAETPTQARQLRAAAYGRISSVINRLEERLNLIKRAAVEYRRLPSINLELPVIVVAGFPNVGKSSLVARLSSAHPEVAEYPFTTKKISVGHFPLNQHDGQILDVPGLLDRPMSERNPIERRAIAAIQFLADVIIFLIDPTLTSGYELSNQIGLLQEIQTTFPTLEIYPIINKCDIASQEEMVKASLLIGGNEIPRISAITDEGVEEVFKLILEQSRKIQEKVKTLHNQLH